MNLNDLYQLLRKGLDRGASDLHLKVPNPPIFRVNDVLIPDEREGLTPRETRDLVAILLAEKGIKGDPLSLKEVDFSYSVQGVGRFRIDIYRQRGSFALAIRLIPYRMRSFEELGLPPVLKELTLSERGLCLVTGAAGSGKSTTLAAMVDYINSSRGCHILTIEDPIEFLHRDKQAIISQREIGTDSDSFEAALRSSLREDADILLIGELRDLVSASTALKAAETGHLVLSTMHTADSIRSIGRMVSFFPSHEQEEARLRLSETLVAVISQRLLPSVDGGTRVLACEIMVVTPAIRECIRFPAKTAGIKEHIEKGSHPYGMQTFDSHILRLFREGRISIETGKAHASIPVNFEREASLFLAGRKE